MKNTQSKYITTKRYTRFQMHGHNMYAKSYTRQLTGDVIRRTVSSIVSFRVILHRREAVLRNIRQRNTTD